MLITLNITNESKKDSFLKFLSTLDYVEIKNNDTSKKPKNNNKKFDDFAGLWEKRDINLQKIRQKAWK